MQEEENVKATYIPLGCTLVELVVGGGVGMGIPAGVVLNVAGDKSSGKTFLTNDCVASAHKKFKNKLKFFKDDTEFGDTMDTEHLYGINIHPEDRKIGKKKVSDSLTVEEFDAKLGLFCDDIDTAKDELGIYIVDSLDGLSTSAKEEASEKRQNQLASGKDVKDDGTYDTSMTKFLSQNLFKTKKDDLRQKNVLLIIISQIRDKFNAMAFSEKHEVTGGKALEFYAHTRLFLTTIRKIERAGKIVGAVVQAETKKSKTPRPFRKCRYIVYFDYGIDDVTSNLCYLFDLLDEKGHFKPSAQMIPWNQKKEPTKDNLIAWLTETDQIKQAKADRKATGGSANLSLDFIEEWIAETPERKAAYEEEFGQTYTLDELIKLADEDSAIRKEIRKRTILKWEAEEEAARTKRPRKYSEED